MNFTVRSSCVPCRASVLVFSVLALGLLLPNEARAQGVAITSIAPAAAGYGESVAITGRGFGGPNVVVHVGGVGASVVSATGNRLTFRVPTGVPIGRVTVIVTNPGGQQAATGFEVSGQVTLTLNDAARVTAVVGSNGGTLVTQQNGVRFTLSIPPGALTTNEAIVVTPIASIKGFPLDRLLGAVHFAPEGLFFSHPAVLRLTFPETANLQGIAAFGASGTGENLHLTPFGADANGITIGVPHFSINGVGSGSAAAGGAGLCLQATLECTYTNALALTLQSAIQSVCGASGCSSPAVLAENIEAIGLAWLPSELALLRTWFDDVLTLLNDEALTSDAGLAAAGRQFQAWRGWVNANACWGFSGCADVPEVAVNIDSGNASLGFAYLSAFERAKDQCNDQRVRELIVETVQLLLLGKGGLPDTESELRTQFGCQLVIEPQFPATVETNDIVPFTVSVGIRTGGASGAVAPVGGQAVTLAITEGCGVIDGGTRSKTLVTTASGVATAQITASLPCIGPTNVIALAVTVPDISTGEVFAFGRTVSLRSALRRRLSLSPASAVIAPGGTVTYTAQIDGASAGVTWAATGGTITAGPSTSATFTAGTTTGTFTVTATSVEDLTLSTTVLVNIEAGDPPPPPPPAGARLTGTLTLTGDRSQSSPVASQVEHAAISAAISLPIGTDSAGRQIIAAGSHATVSGAASATRRLQIFGCLDRHDVFSGNAVSFRTNAFGAFSSTDLIVTVLVTGTDARTYSWTEPALCDSSGTRPTTSSTPVVQRSSPYGIEFQLRGTVRRSADGLRILAVEFARDVTTGDPSDTLTIRTTGVLVR